MGIVAHRKIFYTISALLVGLSIVLIVAFGLKLGIDFTGGSLLELEFAAERPPLESIEAALARLDLGEVRVQPTGERGLLLRLRHINERERQEILSQLVNAAGQENPAPGTRHPAPLAEKRFDTVGPTIGQELRSRSAWAIALVIILIVSYIAWAFRKVSEPMASWKYGVATIIALLHDVLIPAGFFAAGGQLWGFEADTLFVTAVLTILGFSVHDTIVVFDRIREHLKRRRPEGDFAALVSRSVKETFTRSLNTSLTVVLALAAVWAFGGATTRLFSLTLIIGIIVGTYSSLFIASPLLVTWHQWTDSKFKIQSSK